MQLFYHPNSSETSKEIFFDKEESRHIGKVLRKKEGDILDITNGKGVFFKAELTMVSPKKCIATITETTKQQPLPYHLHLAVAPTKSNDRFETFLEKATEIGITEITPIICEHSERKTIKPERFEKILQSAMKQSLKAYLPKLNTAVSSKDFIKQKHSENLLCIAHCEETDKKSFKGMIQNKQSVLVLIGPEGDFSSEEIELAKNNNFIPVTLGDTRLRTETAAIVATHSVSFINQY
ncbi:16S rRNA (uracil(1498)-N(3))-methyltransferase [Marixanthomonas sp. SCSIO 43207]|uniref:16S rRNA (uracil(1498)-N(3))-methyltransferase n=1 Tax=Marixanthomonas sp. SCSIO 43207 TaxID=2779360 RepID=UPI001CA9D71C|nr:16S rRNA (uracil(1498)-N(3))-methyltransferase [Marixanthomonas sp. SCSIO 43207]UAB80656.1 16S rRNA (uracil(1498)-N(3))-methyltransferase [Marixanthomonas sp. SCSIO 43207]